MIPLLALSILLDTAPAAPLSANFDPGFVLAPGEKMRMCTGNPGTQAHGTAPEDDVKNYFLFLPRIYLQGPGTVLTLVLRGLPVAKAEFDPSQPSGVAVSPRSAT